MSDFPLLLFMSPEVITFIGVVLVLGGYAYGLYWSISKLKDPNEKSKSGPALLLIFLLGLLGVFIWSLMPSRNTSVVTTPTPPKTNMAAPQPPSNSAGSMTTAPLPNAAAPIPQANAAPNH